MDCTEYKIRLDVYFPLEKFKNAEEATDYLIELLTKDSDCDYQIYENEVQ